MKKVGLIIFITALTIGLIFANVFSFGETTRFFNFSINESVSGSGNLTTEKRAVSDFHAVKVGGVFEVEIVAQKDFSVEIEAEDNLLPLITTEVRGGVLRLETGERIRTKNPIRVRISAPNFENLEVSGASKVSLVELKNEFFKIDASGASKITVTGETENLTIDVSGASNVNAENLKTANASVDASGASKAIIYATDKIKADAGGASCITYSGSPKNIFKKTSGVSSIKEK